MEVAKMVENVCKEVTVDANMALKEKDATLILNQIIQYITHLFEVKMKLVIFSQLHNLISLKSINSILSDQYKTLLNFNL